MNSEFIIRVLADYTVIFIALVGAYVLLRYVPTERRWSTYARIVMAGLTALLIAKISAAIWQPTTVRPFVEQGVEAGAAYLNNPGFPSDHVLFAAAITLAVYFESSRKRVACLLAVLTLVMGVGRVFALVHTPIDIAGGLVFACLGGLWYLTVPARSGKNKIN